MKHVRSIFIIVTLMIASPAFANLPTLDQPSKDVLAKLIAECVPGDRSRLMKEGLENHLPYVYLINYKRFAQDGQQAMLMTATAIERLIKTVKAEDPRPWMSNDRDQRVVDLITQLLDLQLNRDEFSPEARDHVRQNILKVLELSPYVGWATGIWSAEARRRNRPEDAALTKRIRLRLMGRLKNPCSLTLEL